MVQLQDCGVDDTNEMAETGVMATKPTSNVGLRFEKMVDTVPVVAPLLAL